MRTDYLKSTQSKLDGPCVKSKSGKQRSNAINAGEWDMSERLAVDLTENLFVVNVPNLDTRH